MYLRRSVVWQGSIYVSMRSGKCEFLCLLKVGIAKGTLNPSIGA